MDEEDVSHVSLRCFNSNYFVEHFVPTGKELLQALYTSTWVRLSGEASEVRDNETSMVKNMQVREREVESDSAECDDNQNIAKVMLYIPDGGIVSPVEAAHTVNEELQRYDVVVVATTSPAT